MLLTRFINHIRDQRLLQQSDRLLLAVSGGVDSVVLCELCHRSGLTFEIAHANFCLRGRESDEDELLVRSLADKYQVPIHVRKFETSDYAAEKKVSVQVAARELRYGWFNELLNGTLNFLLTAHHADDNIETVLFNFFRGTGISGLRGMQPVSGKIIRPLLSYTKNEILVFAHENNLQWREDSSNSSDKYSRNYLRNSIVPMVSRIFPEVEQNLTNNIRRFADIEILYRQAIDIHLKKLVEKKGNEIHIPVLKLAKVHPLQSVVYEIIREYGFTTHQVEEVIHLLNADQGKRVSSGSHHIFKNRNWLVIAPLESIKADHVLVEEGENRVEFEDGLLEIKAAEKNEFDPSPAVACVDARKIVFPLILRRWKQGDYFYPLGLGKKKKIARFLIDQKLSPTEKKKVWVLESDKRIVWILGRRIDERFKITDASKSIFIFQLSNQLSH